MTERQNIEYKSSWHDDYLKWVCYVKGKITNKEYQEINQISNRTATYELKELVEEFAVLKKSGASVGIFYELTIGSIGS